MSDLLPVVTEKKHTSYSELVTWLDCSWKHKLKYLDGLKLDGPSEHTEFGKCIHDAMQKYLETRIMPDFADVLSDFVARLAAVPGLTEKAKPKEFHDTIVPILTEVQEFMNSSFKDWTYVSAEQMLYEEAGVQNDRFFKGYIDGIIRVPKSSRLKRAKPDDYEYWIIDWKTTSWGWPMERKMDKKKTLQLVLYKHFWAQKLKVDLTDIRCGFVLLKRTPAKDKETGLKRSRCELVPVSVGDKSIANGLADLGRMLGSVKKKFYSKNRDSCRFCEYKSTVHCP